MRGGTRHKRGLIVFGCAGLLVSCSASGQGDGGGEPTNQVTVQVFNYMDPGTEIFTAVQDGSGNFTKLSNYSFGVKSHEGPAQTYRFTVNTPDGRYGVIVVCKPPTGRIWGYAIFSTLGENKEWSINCGSPPANNTLSGSLIWKTPAPTMGDESAVIHWGSGRFPSSGPPAPDSELTYEVTTHSPVNDLLVIHYDSAGAPYNPDLVWLSRNVPAGTLDIDFNDTTKFKPADRTPITIDCPSSRWPSWATFILADLRFYTNSLNSFSLDGTASYPYDIPKTIPDEFIQPGDRFRYGFFSIEFSSNKSSGSLKYTTSPTNYTCESFLPSPSPASLSDSNGNGRVEISFNTVTSVPSPFSEVVRYWVHNIEDTYYSWSFEFSTDYVGSGPSFSWEFPDLTSLSGWRASWTPGGSPSSKGYFHYTAVGGGTKKDYYECSWLRKRPCNDGFIAGFAAVENP